MVVDGGVHVVETHALAGSPAGLAAQDPVAAAVRDPARVPLSRLTASYTGRAITFAPLTQGRPAQ